MIPNDHAVLLLKFGEQRWMDKIVQGELSFSCTGAFIHQAKTSGNDIQGDLYEGIFARLKNNDSRIMEASQRFGRDLEIINIHDYTLLRRKSSRFKPVFCFYGYSAGDALSEGSIEHLGFNTIRHDFDLRMYSGFTDSLKTKNVISDSHRFTQLTMQPKPVIDRIKITMAINGLGYTMKKVDYDLFKRDTFYIEPTDSYNELFYKFPDYKYQHEARICLKNMKFSNIYERYGLNIGQIPNRDYNMSHEESYFELEAIIGEKKK